MRIKGGSSGYGGEACGVVGRTYIGIDSVGEEGVCKETQLQETPREVSLQTPPSPTESIPSLLPCFLASLLASLLPFFLVSKRSLFTDTSLPHRVISNMTRKIGYYHILPCATLPFPPFSCWSWSCNYFKNRQYPWGLYF